jgi:hypothetical protein
VIYFAVWSKGHILLTRLALAQQVNWTSWQRGQGRRPQRKGRFQGRQPRSRSHMRDYRVGRLVYVYSILLVFFTPISIHRHHHTDRFPSSSPRHIVIAQLLNVAMYWHLDRAYFISGEEISCSSDWVYEVNSAVFQWPAHDVVRDDPHVSKRVWPHFQELSTDILQFFFARRNAHVLFAVITRHWNTTVKLASFMLDSAVKTI